jgi:hypothetical protein
MIKATETVNQYIELIEPEEFYAVECDSTWPSWLVFDMVRINACGTSVIIRYKEWETRGWKNHREQINFTDSDTCGGYGDARHMLNWVTRCIKQAYRDHGKEVPSIKSKVTA